MTRSFALALLLLAACSKEERLIRKADCQPYTTVEPALNAGSSILSGKILDDCMQLIVQYSGCHPDHPFELYWDGEFSATTPDNVEMALHEIFEGITCARSIIDTLYFDLSGLQQASREVNSITVSANEFSSLTLPLDN